MCVPGALSWWLWNKLAAKKKRKVFMPIVNRRMGWKRRRNHVAKSVGRPTTCLSRSVLFSSVSASRSLLAGGPPASELTSIADVSVDSSFNSPSASSSAPADELADTAVDAASLSPSPSLAPAGVPDEDASASLSSSPPDAACAAVGPLAARGG